MQLISYLISKVRYHPMFHSVLDSHNDLFYCHLKFITSTKIGDIMESSAYLHVCLRLVVASRHP